MAILTGGTMRVFKGCFLLVIICGLAILAGCAPEVGSEEWCEDMKEKPKKEWSASEAADYAKHCIFR